MAAAFAKMTSKGQMTIPKQIREALHLKPHDRLFVMTEGERAVIRPMHGDIRDLKGIFKHVVKGPIDFRKLREETERGMAEEALARGRIRKPGS